MDKDEFWADLEKEGEEPVQQKLDAGLYGGAKKTAVIAWLKMKARQRLNQIPWRRTTSGIIIIGLIIAFCAGLGVIYAARYFGWL